LRAAASIGTIWSSSPWMNRVGTSMVPRSPVRSVSEKAAMQSWDALMPTVMHWSQNSSRLPWLTVEPGRLAP
jgi:hypothetical protein